jgi:sigma-B regulation protein RsbU (phosphoserine phosphatase)
MLDAQSVQLISRDLLVLFTDGLVNATSPRGEKFTVERIEKLIREQKTATCKELAEALERELDSFLGGDAPADDIIVLFLRSSH